MPELQPTPGDWQPKQGIDDEAERWIVTADRGDGKGYLVAIIHNGAPGDTLETERVNAHLLAAAKELKAAVERLRAVLVSVQGNDFTISDDVDAADEFARSALAKATGA